MYPCTLKRYAISEHLHAHGCVCMHVSVMLCSVGPLQTIFALYWLCVGLRGNMLLSAVNVQVLHLDAHW